MRNVLKISLITLLSGLLSMRSFAQKEPASFSSFNRIFSLIEKAQSSLKTISYTLKRTDTLVTGDIRTFSGQVQMAKDNNDPVFGFKYWSKTADDNNEQVYNGHVAYLTHQQDQSYQLESNKDNFPYLLYSGSGRLVLPDLIKLDTAKAIAVFINQDTLSYNITFIYPDISEYQVSNRRKIVTIDKLTMLPVALRNHQETLGKVQDIYYKMENVRINDSEYDYTYPPFLKEYKHVISEASDSPVYSLKNKVAPSFHLETFDGKTLADTAIHGKLILLDFWEVWCGPCMASMPKVQQLYERYKSEGLEVYGITNDLKQLAVARTLVKKQKITFPMLIGSEKLKQDYKLNGTVPLYILIDKKGKIALVSEGYPANLEDVIKSML